VVDYVYSEAVALATVKQNRAIKIAPSPEDISYHALKCVV
jgi:hypothetical protein